MSKMQMSKAPMSKTRLDVLLAERGLVESRERAKAVIMSGNVFVAGNRADKPGAQVSPDALVDIRAMPEFVSRGGHKLEKAIKVFGVSPAGKVCIDCGASTGGFTDCLLKNGACLVYAVDVGYGQLAWGLRNDPRVVTMERTNIRHVTADMFALKPEIAVIDVSFISLSLVLPVISGLLTDDGEALCLIKPQFEAGRGQVGKKGVVRDPVTHKSVLDAFMEYSALCGFSVKAISYSPLRGPEGNIEFLGWLRKQGAKVLREETRGSIDTGGIVAEAHNEQSEKNNHLS